VKVVTRESSVVRASSLKTYVAHVGELWFTQLIFEFVSSFATIHGKESFTIVRVSA
jgi:hypothetical protein